MTTILAVNCTTILAMVGNGPIAWMSFCSPASVWRDPVEPVRLQNLWANR